MTAKALPMRAPRETSKRGEAAFASPRNCTARLQAMPKMAVQRGDGNDRRGARRHAAATASHGNRLGAAVPAEKRKLPEGNAPGQAISQPAKRTGVPALSRVQSRQSLARRSDRPAKRRIDPTGRRASRNHAVGKADRPARSTPAADLKRDQPVPNDGNRAGSRSIRGSEIERAAHWPGAGLRHRACAAVLKPAQRHAI